jgi:hypothetical protein
MSMSKLTAAAATVALLAGAFFSTGVSAQYVWNGYGWVHSGAPAYGNVPQNEFNNQATYGYRPRGGPHPNGPDPGGGGCYMGQPKTACSDY